MASSICWNNPRETITSAIWKVIERPWRTIFAPIFTSRSRNVVIDQWLTASGSARVRRKLARLKVIRWTAHSETSSFTGVRKSGGHSNQTASGEPGAVQNERRARAMLKLLGAKAKDKLALILAVARGSPPAIKLAAARPRTIPRNRTPQQAAPVLWVC
jgi:hypothetical protein